MPETPRRTLYLEYCCKDLKVFFLNVFYFHLRSERLIWGDKDIQVAEETVDRSSLDFLKRSMC